MYQSWFRHKLLSLTLALVVSTTIIIALLLPRITSHAAPPFTRHALTSSQGGWPTYLYTNKHQGYNPTETHISASNVASLTLRWKFKTAGNVSAEPIVVNGVVYEGSNDGYIYAINATTGVMNWKTFLNVATSSTCTRNPRGVTGTATVQNGVVYIGAGQYFFALDATTGTTLWKATLGTSGTPNDIVYSGSAVANGKVYVGISSLCDNPLTQGLLYALNTADGTIAAQAAIVPDGTVGGGIWSVPTIDAITRTVIVTTGSVEKKPPIQPMTASIITLNWNTLAVQQFWQVPNAQRIGDADWGCTPTLFPGPGGSGKTYVGCVNKDSIYSVFDEANVSAGPIWQTVLAPGGERGGVTGSFGSAAYLNGVLYIPSALGTVDGINYGGSIGAFDALTGNPIWRFGTAGPLAASVIIANGLLYDAQGKTMEVRDLNTGNVLFSYTVGNIFGSVTVSNGVVYLPSFDNYIYAFAPS